MQRFLAASLLALLSAMLAGPPCDAATPSGPQEAAALPDLTRPNLQSLIPSAREEIQKAYAFTLAHPREASANGKLGMLLHAYGLLADAEICYRRAWLLDPATFQWAYYLGMVQNVQAKCSEAVPTLRAALLLRPDYFPAQLGLGECLVVERDWENAGKLYETLLHAHPESAEANYGLGRVREARRDLTAAVESYRRACELFPKFSAAHFALARVYQRLGKHQEASGEQGLADKSAGGFPLIEDPVMAEVESLYRDYNAYLKLGTGLGGQGKWKEAAQAFEEALRINPELPQAHVRLIYIYTQLGQLPQAEEHFRAAVRLQTKSAEAYFNYGMLMLHESRTRDAEEAFRSALKIDPKYAQAHNNLGYLLEGQGKLPEAVAEFRRALENDPNIPQAHFSLGRILVKQGEFEEGLTHLLKALRTDDEDAKSSYLYAAGLAYAEAGDLENGLRYLHLAREKAAARKQAKLLASIDDDLRLLQSTGSLP